MTNTGNEDKKEHPVEANTDEMHQFCCLGHISRNYKSRHRHYRIMDVSRSPPVNKARPVLRRISQSGYLPIYIIDYLYVGRPFSFLKSMPPYQETPGGGNLPRPNDYLSRTEDEPHAQRKVRRLSYFLLSMRSTDFISRLA